MFSLVCFVRIIYMTKYIIKKVAPIWERLFHDKNVGKNKFKIRGKTSANATVVKKISPVF